MRHQEHFTHWISLSLTLVLTLIVGLAIAISSAQAATLTVTSTADTTPPVITPNVSGPLGHNGWYVDNVIISWSVVDPESAIISQNGCGNQSVTRNTFGITFACEATSAGGYNIQGVTIKRDATPPNVRVTGVISGFTYTLGSVPVADCLTTDEINLVATPATLSLTGGNADGTGNFTVTCSGAIDEPGNRAAPVSVNYTVDPPPAPGVIRVMVDVQPDSKTNFKFTGDLGAFYLDDIAPQDSDAFTNTTWFSASPGIYTIQAPNLSGWFVTDITCTPTADRIIDLDNRQAIVAVAPHGDINCLFVIQRAGRISAGKYNDHNHNHRRNSTDEWLSGWTMQLYNDLGTLVATQTTNTNGRTTFTNLRPGVYILCEVAQSGWFNITPPMLEPTFNQPCYLVSVAPGKLTAALFGNSTTPPVAAAEHGDFDHVTSLNLPDTDDEGNVSGVWPEPWTDQPEESTNRLFLPLMLR